jgi:hypothetical protein
MENTTSNLKLVTIKTVAARFNRRKPARVSTNFWNDSKASGTGSRAMTWENIKIWKDGEGKLWTLADAGIDAEIFELLGEPVYDEAAGLWHQEIALRGTID